MTQIGNPKIRGICVICGNSSWRRQAVVGEILGECGLDAIARCCPKQPDELVSGY